MAFSEKLNFTERIVCAGNRKLYSYSRLCLFFLLLQNMCSFKFKTQHVLWKCQWKPRIALFYEYRIPISILLPWTFRKLQNHYPIQVNLNLRDILSKICTEYTANKKWRPVPFVSCGSWISAKGIIKRINCLYVLEHDLRVR